MYTSQAVVDAMLSDLKWEELVGHHQPFNTTCYAVSTMQKFQRLEALQPALAWKPLEVIKRTLAATTQWATKKYPFPMKNHHESRFPWNDRTHLMEEVGMETYFMPVTGIGNFNCSQLFLGFMSRMINLYPMPQKGDGHIDKAYADFMRYEGVPSCLHHDLASEQKSDSLKTTNRRMMVRDSFSEHGCPNQNPTESHGVRIIKMGAEGLKIRTGAPDNLWPLMHEYLADINNHCATPFLNWRTPIEKRHGYTPDISAYLMYQFYEPVYFRTHEKDK